MDISKNPFREFRAEQMKHDLWKLYVPGPFENILTPRPLILEGGRGSGKTMFFLCNSWREKIKSLKFENKSMNELLTPNEFIGLYYKVDTAFVTSMEERGNEDWDGVFSTYLGVQILKEALYLLKVFVESGIINISDLFTSLKQINKLLINKIDVLDIDNALFVCEEVLDGIEKAINSPLEAKEFRPTVIGRVFNKFIEQLRLIPQLSNISFRIFIDEYETLLEYQQKLVNTLIKHSNNMLIYNIGMRPKGMKTSKTSGGGAEIIQAPHDYNLFKPELFFDSEEDLKRTEYYDMLKEVCKLRINTYCATHGLKNVPDDIEFYLGKYNMDKEIENIINCKSSPPFLERLKKLIISLETDPEKSAMYINELAANIPPLNARLHLCLLLRSETYKPSLENLLFEYCAWKKGESPIYKDWYHNSKYGLVFLLAREYDRQKQYNGVDVFLMLSTGVIRYFLELCEQAFDFAMLDGFDWSAPRTISSEEQTRAARYVSKYKIKDIDGYEPHGRSLRIFVQNIGNIFREFHRSPDLTLGEPEPNHICTSDFSIKDRAKTILNSALMWGVIQEREPTKEKSSILPIETVDYHINKMYCPYFEISYRKKRKLTLSAKIFETLLSGDELEAKEAAHEIISRKRKQKEFLKTNGEQLTFFDGDEEFD
jgi:hypothetical protein